MGSSYLLRSGYQVESEYWNLSIGFGTDLVPSEFKEPGSGDKVESHAQTKATLNIGTKGTKKFKRLILENGRHMKHSVQSHVQSNDISTTIDIQHIFLYIV